MFRLLTLSLCISLFPLPLIVAQSLDIPTSWRKPTSSLSRSDRLSLLQGLLKTITPTLDAKSGLFQGLTLLQTASMLCALAMGDQINSSTTNEDTVLQSLDTTFILTPNISGTESIQFNCEPAMWGLAAIYAYKAYKNPTSLLQAQSMWTQLSGDFVTTENATSGIRASGGTNISSTCNGASTAGAVFFIHNYPDILGVNGETVAAFMALSAHLYEQTSMLQYLDSAILSATFIINQMYDGAIIIDTIDIGTCHIDTLAVTYNSGFTIDGLSVLSVVAPTSDFNYGSFLSKLISTVVVSTHWTNSTDGVIFEGPHSPLEASSNGFGAALKAILIRGLYQAYSRIPPNTPEAAFISSFITVQLNALLDRASIPGLNQYSPQWEGPPSWSLLPWGQLAAIDVFAAAIGLSQGNSSSVQSTTTYTTIPLSIPVHGVSSQVASPSTSAVNIFLHGTSNKISPGVIGGIVAATIGFLLLLLLVILVLRRRRSRSLHMVREMTMETTAQPYDLIGDQNASELRNIPEDRIEQEARIRTASELAPIASKFREQRPPTDMRRRDNPSVSQAINIGSTATTTSIPGPALAPIASKFRDRR